MKKNLLLLISFSFVALANDENDTTLRKILRPFGTTLKVLASDVYSKVGYVQTEQRNCSHYNGDINLATTKTIELLFLGNTKEVENDAPQGGCRYCKKGSMGNAECNIEKNGEQVDITLKSSSPFFSQYKLTSDDHIKCNTDEDNTTWCKGTISLKAFKAAANKIINEQNL